MAPAVSLKSLSTWAKISFKKRSQYSSTWQKFQEPFVISDVKTFSLANPWVKPAAWIDKLELHPQGPGSAARLSHFFAPGLSPPTCHRGIDLSWMWLDVASVHPHCERGSGSPLMPISSAQERIFVGPPSSLMSYVASLVQLPHFHVGLPDSGSFFTLLNY